MIEKLLVFHFFVPDDYETNLAIKMHLECLRRYASVFDRAEFYISTRSGNETLLTKAKKEIFSLYQWNDIKIKVVEADDFCEARTFKENVVDKIDKFNDTLIFFGHTKGTTNVVNFSDNAEHFLKWIHALYFYSLEFVYEVEKKLLCAFQGRFRSLFGPMMEVNDNGHAGYPGAFYWLNPMAISNDRARGYVKIDKLADRIFVEAFPSIYKYYEINGMPMGRADGHNCIYSRSGQFNMYRCNFDEVVNYFGESEKFFAQHNEIMAKILGK